MPNHDEKHPSKQTILCYKGAQTEKVKALTEIQFYLRAANTSDLINIAYELTRCTD